MSSYKWPPSLPQAPTRDGYGETLGVFVMRTPMDSGPAKLRYKGKRPDGMTMKFVMSGAQVATLDDFVKNVLMGVRRFDFTHPRTGAIVEVRIVQESEGAYYSLSRIGADLWDVGIRFEVLP